MFEYLQKYEIIYTILVCIIPYSKPQKLLIVLQHDMAFTKVRVEYVPVEYVKLQNTPIYYENICTTDSGRFRYVYIVVPCL